MANEIEFDESIYNVLLKTFEKELKAELKEYYVWKFNSKILNNPIISSEVKNEILSVKDVVDNIPKRTFLLKNKLQENMEKMNADDKKLSNYAYWIINDWGGISNYKRNPKNDDRIKNVKKCIDCRKYDIPFEAISSLSKVASFLRGTDYAVYDSRVAFTLNWLIFVNEETRGKIKFFRQPDGKNSDLKAYSQRQLDRFKIFYGKKGECNKKFFKSFYYERKETYQKYCELLDKTVKYYENHKSKYSQIGKNQISIGELEMCLFSIAAKNKKIKEPCKYDEHDYITDDIDRVWLEKPSKIAVKNRDR